MRAPARIPRNVVVIAWGALVLSLVVRELWVFLVQSPYGTIYSDMAGYVEKARELVDGVPRVYPRLRAFYPYGTHYVFALLFKVLGEDHDVLVRIVYAAMASFPAFHFVLLASRIVRGTPALALLGVLFAVWQPIVWVVGFFVSEVPFLWLLYWNAWLAVQFAETRRGGLRLGCTSAILFAVRPQFILTFAFMTILFALERGPLLFRRNAFGSYARVLVPWVAVLAFSAARLHSLSGRWGLISENSGLNRVLSDTTYARVDARWTAPDGGGYWFWISAPAKEPVGESGALAIAGYIGDGALLDAERRKFLADKSLAWRVRRAFRNVQLLWLHNDPWPEEELTRPRPRHELQKGFNAALRHVVLPLASIGLLTARRRVALAVVFAHLLTLIGLAMFFFPEARYRCPYDPMLLLLALAGVLGLANLVRQRLKLPSAAKSGESL
jgi:hypothetical protein